MQHDPARVVETRAWLEKASDDLRAAGLMFTAVPPLLGIGVFHCQQATEKALKGFLAWHDEPFRKTHDLEDLGGQCAALDATLEPIARRAIRLTDYVWKFRYPETPGAPSEAETQAALALAREVYAEVLERLPPEVRPS